MEARFSTSLPVIKYDFARKYPQVCGPSTLFYEEVDVEWGPGWRGLIEALMADLMATPPAFEGVEITDISTDAFGLVMIGQGFSSAQRRCIHRAQRVSRTVCEICGNAGGQSQARCNGCRLSAIGANQLAFGWRRFASRIVHELEDIGNAPVASIRSWQGYLVIYFDSYHATEKQERLIAGWNNTLRGYCEVCGKRGRNARCATHR